MSKVSNILSLLQHVALFEKFTAEELSEILAMGQVRRIEEGSFVFQQGDPAAYIYVLTGGRVHLNQVTQDGQQIILRMIVPGQMFGAIGLATPGVTYPVSAEVIEDSECVAWDVNTFRRFGEKNPAVVFDMMNLMSAYIQEIHDRYRELATERTEQRVARALLRLVAQSGRKVEEGILVDMTLSRQTLAEMTGTTLYTVSRLLSEWERRGLIRAGRERVVIIKPHDLVRIAEDLEK